MMQIGQEEYVTRNAWEGVQAATACFTKSRNVSYNNSAAFSASEPFLGLVFGSSTTIELRELS